MQFLQNIWYMAGWSEDISNQPVFRKIANHPIVLYRKTDNEIFAISDTCPHRFAPLHQGRVIEDTIQCPYHGLRYDGSGACVHNPHGDGVLPKIARVNTYPLVERDTIIWLWIGDPARQDPSQIADFSMLNNVDNEFTITRGGTLRMNVRYDLIIDNLMDLSHASFLHMKNLGSEALARGIISVRTEGTTIYSNRMGPNGLPAPVFAMTGACGADEYVDYWVDMRWSPPANFYLDAGVVPTGRPRRPDGNLLPSAQILTPESDNCTVYYLKFLRNYNREDEALSETILQAVMQAFMDEDEWMVNLVSERMEGREFWSLKPILLQSDGGAVQTRRMLEKLVLNQISQA